MDSYWTEQHYRALLENLFKGFALCRIISGPQEPPDFIFIDTNHTFESMTGLKNVSGKKFSELNPFLTDTGHNLYDLFADVAATGTPKRVETYAETLNLWLDISVYSPMAGHFVLILDDITRRKAAELALREQKILFEKMTGNIPVMLYQFERRTDGTYCIPYSNIRIYDIFGSFPQDVIDEFEPILKTIHPEDIDKFIQSIEESGRTLLPWQCEIRVQLPGHELKWISARSTPEKTANGAIIWSGYAIDVTKRKAAEQALQESRDFYEKIISKVPGMVYQFTRKPDGTYCLPYCNISIRNIYECDPEDVRENFAPIYEKIHPDDRDRAMKSVEESARNMTPWMDEHRVVIPGKPITWVMAKSTPEKLADGTILWTGHIVDITYLKNIEQELKNLNEVFAKLTSRVPGMLYRFVRRPDGTYHLPYSSEGIRDIFGCAPEDVRDSIDATLNLIVEEDRQKMLPAVEESAKNLSLWTHEYRVQIPGKPVRWILGNSIPEKLPDGSIVWCGYDTDITEHKLAEQEKELLHTQLIQAQKMESVGRLAGGIAHDFNNMLSVILGNSEIAMEDLDPSSQIYKHLQEILNAGRRSADLTRQLLTFARKQIATPKVLNLNETVTGMLKMLQRLIGEDIELAWKPSPDLWKIKIDPSQIDQLLANLTVNSRDAIRSVGKIIIETSNKTFSESESSHKQDFLPGDYIMLAVSDNGSGMDKETAANIFEPFFTTKKEGQGTGLGLATVYGIVKQNNGFIYVYSEPEKGTTFKIYLPRHYGDDIETSEKKSGIKILGGTETIMVVEDETPVLNFIRSVLEKLGYSIIASCKPFDAVKIAGQYQEKIDLLLTDVIMPDMNGKELSEKISTIQPGVKCLYMSGYTAEVISRQGILNEGVNFITKPFSSKELACKVREVLDS